MTLERIPAQRRGSRRLDPRPACVGCVLEARRVIPPSRTCAQGGEAIARRMFELDLNLRNLAARGFALSVLSKWLNGHATPSPEIRPRLAAALEMPQVELEALLPRPGRRSRDPRADWRCARHQTTRADDLEEASA